MSKFTPSFKFVTPYWPPDISTLPRAIAALDLLFRFFLIDREMAQTCWEKNEIERVSKSQDTTNVSQTCQTSITIILQPDEISKDSLPVEIPEPSIPVVRCPQPSHPSNGEDKDTQLNPWKIVQLINSARCWTLFVIIFVLGKNFLALFASHKLQRRI